MKIKDTTLLMIIPSTMKRMSTSRSMSYIIIIILKQTNNQKNLIALGQKKHSQKLKAFKNIEKTSPNVVTTASHTMQMECARIAITPKEELRRLISASITTEHYTLKVFAKIAT